MAEITARYKPGQEVTGFATAQVNAGRFVKVTGAKTAQGDYPIAHAGAGELTFGVAQCDSAPASQPATDQERRVNVVRPGAIARVVLGEALAVGDLVTPDADGKAVEADVGDYVAGVVVSGGLNEDDIAEVDLTGGVNVVGPDPSAPWPTPPA